MQVTLQEYAVRPVRIGVGVLTTSYVAGTVIGGVSTDSPRVIDEVDDYNFLALEVQYAHGSLTTAEIKVEFSDDNSTWYQIVGGSKTAGVDTASGFVAQLATTDGNFYININAEAFNGGQFKTKYIRISAKGTGTLTSSLMTIYAVVGVA